VTVPRTIPQVLEETARAHGDAPALRQPAGSGYTTWSWNQYRQAALEIAAGLRTLGIRKGDTVALHSETRAEFYLADLGILTNGSVSAALYPGYPAPDLVRTLIASGARAVFVEEPKTLRGIEDAPVSHRILLTGEAHGAITLDALRQRGRAEIARGVALPEVHPSDPAILYLTSGATGEPKMALVTHAAVTANIEMGPHVLPLGPEDSTVAFLPSAHIAQRVVIEFLPLRCGMPVTFSESLNRLPHEIRKVRPTILLAPPRMWERIYTTICTELRKRPAAAQKLFWAGLALGIAAARHRRAGESVPLRIRAPLKLADRVLFRKVRQRFGGRIRVAASGAAPLAKDLAEFYEAVGMPLIEGYGLTEAGVVCFNPIDGPKPGSIGKALPGVEINVSDEGELLVKSPCLFTGYRNDPETTAEVLRGGWLHTGDVGHRDSDGYYFITGRKKELIVSSTGKKVFPSRVENLFKMEPLISHVFLVGDRLPYLTALVTVNPGVAHTLKGMEASTGPVSEAAPVLDEIRRTVSRINKQLAPFEQVRKYRILPRDFTIDEGELTATMKVRRAKVLENFREQIEELYAGRD
jgi:long-chain acyl-CoA synthetase